MSLFLDSNVIIEFAKDNPKAVKLLETLFNGEFRVFINSIVYSEVFFIFL
ncbi:PIN domain-containing protein [Pyrococcus kukulkanii]